MTISNRVPRGNEEGERDYLPGEYRWTCTMCGGMGIVDHYEESLIDCPKCAAANIHGVAYEVMRRDVASLEAGASPAVQANRYAFEIYEFSPLPGKSFPEARVRKVAVEDELGAAMVTKWDLEEASYGREAA